MHDVSFSASRILNFLFSITETRVQSVHQKTAPSNLLFGNNDERNLQQNEYDTGIIPIHTICVACYCAYEVKVRSILF